MTAHLKKPSPFDITAITNPISNMKSPMPLGFYKDVWDHFSVSTWNSGGDQGMYINMHLQQYFRSGMIMPPLEKKRAGAGHSA